MGHGQSTPVFPFEVSQDVTLPQAPTVPQEATNSEKAVVAFRERSRSVSPAGFKNRKVELKDGYLVVSEKDQDSACTSVMGDMIDEWENVYSKHRDDIVDQNGFISTPLHCVKQIAAKLKMEMHMEHYILGAPDIKNRKTVYRVDILMGELRGSGQCTRKQLARQLAAIDLYEKLQLQQTDLGFRPTPMPRCALLPGWRVDKIVFPTLCNEVCKQQNLGTPIFKLIPPLDNRPGKFLAICKVGENETWGENDHPWLAKRLAAKEMYEVITGHEFRVRETLMGCDVLGFPQMRLLGFDPQITSVKRKWMMDHRIQDTQIVIPSDEPDDGEMADVEEEFQNQQSKRLKICNFQENFRITLNNQLPNKSMPNLKVIAVNDQAAGPSDIIRQFVTCNNNLQGDKSANFKVTIQSQSNIFKENGRHVGPVSSSSSTSFPSSSENRPMTPIPNFLRNQESVITITNLDAGPLDAVRKFVTCSNTFQKDKFGNLKVTIRSLPNNFKEDNHQVVQPPGSPRPIPTSSGSRVMPPMPRFPCKQESFLDEDDSDFDYGDFDTSDEDALLS